jgi:hypothetical protein
MHHPSVWLLSFSIVLRMALPHTLRGEQEKAVSPSVEITRSNSTNPTLQLTASLHEISGSQHLTIYTGQPPIARTLIVDTGSRLTAWRCDSSSAAVSSSTLQVISCGACQYPRTSCHKNNTCVLTQRYTEGSSWTAHEAQDIVSLGNTEDALEQSALLFRYGYQTHLTGLFKTQFADGILGLERSEYSLVHQMYQEGLISSNSFSICLAQSGGGLISFGSPLRARHLEPMKYSPNLRGGNSGLYVVCVLEVWLGRTCLACGDDKLLKAFNAGSGTVLDSVS